MAPIITLLTDFGLRDAYVASLKGVILSICPEARIIDITHLIPPQDIRAGAFLLGGVYKEFPRKTIHVAVVDPGVGTSRRPLVIETQSYFFVGPDNGLFSWVLKKETGWEARTLENRAYWRSVVSSTFHGRDIFAPVAAHLANGIPVHALGPLTSPAIAQWSVVARAEDTLCGEVIYIDHFGNVVTNITEEDLNRFRPLPWTIHAGRHTITKVVKTYGEAASGTVIALVGSNGYLEIAVNQGNASEALGLNVGAPVTLRRRNLSHQNLF